FNNGGKMYNRGIFNADLRSQGVLELPSIHGVTSGNTGYKDDTSGPPADLDVYQSNIAFFARHFKGKIPWAEPYNEPNLKGHVDAFGGQDAFMTNFQKIQKTFYEGIKQGAGNMKVAYTGLAGFEPQYYELLCQKGFHKYFDALNGHQYCQDQPPSLGRSTAEDRYYGSGIYQSGNTLLDGMRLASRIRDKYAPGNELWITEFGWTDTINLAWRVGKYLQAAYAVRAWVHGMANGIDKMFWYFWGDTKNLGARGHFFGGMGFYDYHRWQPKPVCGAFNVMNNLLEDAEYVGDLFDETNSFGYVFKRKNGRPVVVAWSVYPNDDFYKLPIGDPLPRDMQYVDMFGNRKAFKKGKRFVLGNGPVYITSFRWNDNFMTLAGVSENAPWEWRTVSGNTEEFQVRMDGRFIKVPVKGKISFKLPPGFEITPAVYRYNAGSGLSKKTFKLKIPYDARVGKKYNWEVRFDAASGEKKHFRKKIILEEPVNLLVEPVYGDLSGTNSRLVGKITYNGAEPLKVGAKLKLPPALKADTDYKSITLKPRKINEVLFTLQKSGSGHDFSGGTLTVGRKDLKLKAQKPIQVAQAVFKKLPEGIDPDGELDDWPQANKMPPAMIEKHEVEKGAIYAGWNREGLYFAFSGSKNIFRQKHKAFWSSDYIEIWLDTANSQADSFVETSHQFFISFPDSNNPEKFPLKVGQWHRDGDALNETQFQVRGIEHGFAKDENKWVMELFFPRTVLKDFSGEAGSKISINFNIVYKKGNEFSWVANKRGGDMARPDKWGTVILQE
ncbi:MAG TPA: sugar-binding protein, partial [Spirochaetota bacterium]|nr:sugar-binding protein [Spirochaetota bacterium]